VLEAAGTIGTGTSSRNSEVLHAGIYYPKGSLKAKLCVSGQEQLYTYCKERGIAHQRCGKLIVATEEAQHEALAGVQRMGLANGVAGLEWLSGSEVSLLEPEVTCTAALLSPNTGIIDSHQLMLALQGDAEEHGAVVCFHTPVTSGEVISHGGDSGKAGEVLVHTPEMTFVCEQLVNCSGLAAADLAKHLQQDNSGDDKTSTSSHQLQHFYAKGNYFKLATAQRPFSRLVYPLPNQHGFASLSSTRTYEY
jgi:L-2-hydroxyglutarate oxidase LhgO